VAYGSNGFVYGSFSSTGVFTAFSIAGLPSPGLGMAGDSVTGELITVSSAGLIAINPTTNTFRVINAALTSALDFDGVSISPDGQTVYIAQFGQNVTGYNVHTGAQVFTGPKPVGSYFPDGTGVISSSNALNGDIVVNDNGGNLYLINPVLNTITLIGTNANERGDYTSPDFSNGTLLLDYTDEVERLSCGPGCGIGSGPPPTTTPEPGTLMLLGVSLLGLAGVAKRKFQS
jgi:hypothetical protein